MVVHVLFDGFPIIQKLSVSTIELMVVVKSPLLLRICIVDHESCGCMIFFNSFHFT